MRCRNSDVRGRVKEEGREIHRLQCFRLEASCEMSGELEAEGVM